MDNSKNKKLTKEALQSNPALTSLILQREVQRLRAKASKAKSTPTLI